MNATTSNGPSATMRCVWGVLGLFFAFLTMRVLLWEVHGFNDMMPEHWLTVGAMVGAVTAGIYFWQMLWSAKVLTAAGLALAFCGATIYCLVGSAGRGDPWRRWSTPPEGRGGCCASSGIRTGGR